MSAAGPIEVKPLTVGRMDAYLRFFDQNAFTDNPRWAEDLKSVELRQSREIARGGCRLLAGAGIVDATIDGQIGILGDALLRAIDEEDARQTLEAAAGSAAGEGGRR